MQLCMSQLVMEVALESVRYSDAGVDKDLLYGGLNLLMHACAATEHR